MSTLPIVSPSPLELCSRVLTIYSRRVVRAVNDSSCDTVSNGFQCSPDISHFWGQYSPYFAVDSDIDNAVPGQCTLTFVQILSRHGARDPTSSKTAVYNTTIQNQAKRMPTFVLKISRIIHLRGMRARLCLLSLGTEPPPMSEQDDQSPRPLSSNP